MEISEEQVELCKKLKVEPLECPSFLKVGISLNVKCKVNFPLNGLRHLPTSRTTGWYIWSGEYSDDENFFRPLHVKHLLNWDSKLLKYLALPPGYRFLLGENEYEDIWFDENLLIRG